MSRRPSLRLRDAETAIQRIRQLLGSKSSEALEKDFVTRAAYERLLEVLSEATRHLPAAWKEDEPSIPWRRIADLGNVLRHAYHDVDADVLWDIFEARLEDLDAAISRLKRKHDPDV